MDTVDGYLKAGDHLILRFGDRRFGGPGTRVQTFVEQGFRFRCYVDPLGTSRFAAVAECREPQCSAPRVASPGCWRRN